VRARGLCDRTRYVGRTDGLQQRAPFDVVERRVELGIAGRRDDVERLQWVQLERLRKLERLRELQRLRRRLVEQRHRWRERRQQPADPRADLRDGSDMR
jgi:hypothetical protein